MIFFPHINFGSQGRRIHRPWDIHLCKSKFTYHNDILCKLLLHFYSWEFYFKIDSNADYANLITPKAGTSQVLDDTKGLDLTDTGWHQRLGPHRYWMTRKAWTSQILDDTKGWDLTDTGGVHLCKLKSVYQNDNLRHLYVYSKCRFK